jgi:polar amino acid transport system substrate-binding protein
LVADWIEGELAVRRTLPYLLLSLMILLGSVCPVQGEGLSVKAIRACDDIQEWPPFIYYKREGGKPTADVVGFTAELIREILAPYDVTLTIDLMPWRRCLREVEKGSQYQILLDASTNADRAERYHISKPYYSISPYYFYSKKQHPDGLPIKTMDDLKQYRINGIAGYNYADYGLKPEDLDAIVNGHEGLIQKLHRGRCDLFPEWYEVMRGFAAVGKPYLEDEDLGYAAVPGAPLTPFYLMFPKNALGLELKTVVDEGIEKMTKSGRLAEMLSRYTR